MWRVCLVLQVLQHASPAHLTSLTAALDQLDERYAYDVNYLNGFIKWRVCLPALRLTTLCLVMHVCACVYQLTGLLVLLFLKDGSACKGLL